MAPVRVKTCCFFLKLRTGCYIIGILYLLFAALLIIEEFKYAVYHFRTNLNNGVLAVAFAYDLVPTVILVFSSCFLYGLYNNNKLLIYSGASLTFALLLNNISSIVMLCMKIWLSSNPYYALMYYADYIILCGVLLGFLIVTLSHHEQIGDRSQKLNEEDENPHEFVNELNI